MTLPVGFAGPNQLNGATEPISAVDIRLDALSTPVQSVNMTTTGLNFYLPNATEKKTGGPVFIISAVATSQTFVIRDFAGNAITTVAAGAAVILSLTNNISSAGSWSCKAFSSITQLIAGTATVGNAVVSTYIKIAPLTATTALIVYSKGGGTGAGLFSVVVTVTGGSVAFSTPVNLSLTSGADPFYIGLTNLSATQCMATWQNGTTTFLESVVINISGTTPSYGVLKVVNAVASTYTSVAALSATQAICAYGVAAAGSCVTLNVSGSTITAGAVAVLDASATTYTAICALSSTKAIVAYNNGGAVVRTKVLDVSGTTITPGTVLNVDSVNPIYTSIATLSSTKAICVYQGATSYLYAVILDVSVSTVTAGTILTVDPTAMAYASVSALNATTAVVYYGIPTGALPAASWASLLTVSTSTITAGTPVRIATSGTAGYQASCALSANKIIGASTGASSFLNAETIEYTVSV